MGQLGAEGAGLLKRELVHEGKTKERLRILEVIDTITRDLKTNLAYAIGDGNAVLRQAAFQLAERLNDSPVVNLMMEYATGPELQLAVEAIECLGRLKPAAAVKGLVSLLGTTKEKERLLACCRALGQIPDPASIEPLAKILARKRFSFHGKRRANLRAAAIFALGQILHPQVAKILLLYREDPDPRIREIARTRELFGKLSSPKPPIKEKPVATGPAATPGPHS